MASSSYYYRKYKDYRDKVKTLKNQITKLNDIKNSLINNFYDEQSNVNKEINDLKDELKESIRHDSKFNTIASGYNKYKEKVSTADKSLGSTAEAIDSEISNLNSQKQTAERNRDSYYQKYEREKENERQRVLSSLKNIF